MIKQPTAKEKAQQTVNTVKGLFFLSIAACYAISAYCEFF